jgi:phage terminase large subunit-like protein
MVLAAEKDQAGVVFDYIAGFFDNVPMLAGLVEKRGKGKESIRLRNRVTIRVQVASFRRLRGRTVACAILDENAFWYSDEESRNPDTEILKALRPSMATIPGSLLIAISSPYAKRGILWDAYRRYFGKDGARVLV